MAKPASHPPSPIRSAAQLGAIRRAESQKSWALLGLPTASVIRLGLPDVQLTQHGEPLRAALKQQLRASDVVVTTWQHDGHPDHKASGICAMRACAEVGCRLLQAPVWMWHWATPGDARVPWTRLQRLEILAPAWARERAALQAHHSQLSAGSPGKSHRHPVLDAAIVDRASRRHAYFFI